MSDKAPEKFDEDLFNRIMARIEREKIKTARRKAVFFAGTFLISVLASWPSFNLLRADLAASGFLDYLSLVFSDFGIVAVYWQSFSLALLETLPLISVIISLTLVWIMLESLKLLVRDFKNTFKPVLAIQ
ncbi:MAG: hypothetical protein WC517_04240 [Patescibacteria group bacterium]